jgi:hypothetical protein
VHFNIKKIISTGFECFKQVKANINNRIGSIESLATDNFKNYTAYNPTGLIPQKGRLTLDTPYIGVSLGQDFDFSNFQSPQMVIYCPFETIDPVTNLPIDGDLLNAFNNGVEFRNTL